MSDVSRSTGDEPSADLEAQALDVAFALAEQVGRSGNVPVGACIVAGERIIARAGNLRETLNDPCAHAEVLALREAARMLGSWRLEKATLYVTLEPCAMCAGAILQSRVGRVVYALEEPRSGAHVSLHRLFEGAPVRVERRQDMAARSAALLERFFGGVRART